MEYEYQYDLRELDITEADLLRQFEFEHRMKQLGGDRYLAKVQKDRARGAGGSSGGARTMLANLVVPMADMIVEEIARLEEGRVKRKPPELRSLKLIPPREMAALALRMSIDHLLSNGGELTRVRLAYGIGATIDAEARMRRFYESEEGLYKHVLKRVQKTTDNSAQITKQLLTAYENVGGEAQQMLTQDEQVRLGVCLIQLLCAQGVVSEETFAVGRTRTKTIVKLSPTMLEAITKLDSNSALLMMEAHPCVIPPRPWSSATEGAYWSDWASTRLISKRTPSCGVTKATVGDMPRMFTPMNYMQATPFAVNKRVLAVVVQMQEANIAQAGLPPSELTAFPDRPHDIETNEEARAVYRKAKGRVHALRAQQATSILRTKKIVRMATDMAEETEFYYPKRIDFRGRVYDMVAFMNPQGDDLSKGLLLFANGKALGEVGGYWLAVHGANVWGEDKVSLDCRVAWVQANEQAITEIAADPFGNRMWMDADKPFQFLAFCFEWAEALAQGDDYVSHLAVALDGSCNGLQHLSALLRDPVGGKAVNLVPADRPQDIYTEVLNAVVAKLKERAAQGEPTAQAWLPLMKRNVVKRPVMTLPYGACRTGFAGQIMEDTLAELKDDPFPEGKGKAAAYLAGLVWEAAGEVVVAAQEVMGWLQDVARISAKANVPIEWTTPSGFRVLQAYRDSKSRKVDMLAFGQRISVRVAQGFEDKIDSRKTASAIAPNFVHAMDAAHMLRTVEMLLDTVGPSVHLSMIHDSYGTHAADAESLSFAIRQSFVQMYEETCWLTAFRDEVAAALPPEVAAKLPPVPQMRDLDISEVVNSQYFFA